MMNNFNKDDINKKTLKKIVDSIKDCIFVKDLNGKYVYANNSFLKTFDLKKSDLCSIKDSEFINFDKTNDIRLDDKEILQTLKVIIKKEVIYLNSGLKLVLEITKSPIYDENEKLFGIIGVLNNITRKEFLKEEIKDNKRLFSLILDNLSSLVYIKNESKELEYVNARLAKTLDIPRSKIIGKKPEEIYDLDLNSYFLDDEEVLENDKVIEKEDYFMDKNNKLIYYKTKIKKILIEEKPLIFGYSYDVTNILNIKDKLKQFFLIDNLTKLYSRKYFEDYFKNEFNIAKKYNMPFSLLLLDIFKFRNINEKYGFVIGDEILKRIGKVLKKNLVENCIPCRVGSNEFAVFLPIDDKKTIKQIRGLILNSFEEKIIVGEFKVQVRLIEGHSLAVEEDKSFEDMYSRVDKILHQNKLLMEKIDEY